MATKRSKYRKYTENSRKRLKRSEFYYDGSDNSNRRAIFIMSTSEGLCSPALRLHSARCPILRVKGRRSRRSRRRRRRRRRRRPRRHRCIGGIGGCGSFGDSYYDSYCYAKRLRLLLLLLLLLRLLLLLLLRRVLGAAEAAPSPTRSKMAGLVKLHKPFPALSTDLGVARLVDLGMSMSYLVAPSSRSPRARLQMPRKKVVHLHRSRCRGISRP